MALWAKIAWTCAGALAIGAIVYLLLYVGAPGVLYLGEMLGGAKIQQNYAFLVHLFGIGSLVLSGLVFAAAVLLVIWILRMWR